MGLDLGAVLSNLANKISGGGSGDGGANNVGATGGASGASGGGRVNSYQANNAAETAIGEQLSGNKYEAESAKTIEEKVSAALDELMSSLGLAAGDADEMLTEMSSAIETEIETREAEEAKELEDTVEESIVNETEETELDPEVQGILDGMSDEELDALKKAIEEEQKDREFTDEEAATFASGEEEVQARVKEAIENKPDMDPAEVEAKVREAYELENPEYAAAAEEAANVLQEHNAAMEEAYAAYQEENPMPNEADYSNPTEYLAAMNEWTAAAEEHMNEQEAKYREENENYDNLMDAVEWENKNDIFERIKESFIGIYTDEAETKNTIKRIYENKNYLIDTHTAVAMSAAMRYISTYKAERKVLVVSTASPYKFAKDVFMSLEGKVFDFHDTEAPKMLSDLTGTEIPTPLSSVLAKKILHPDIIGREDMDNAVLDFVAD